MTRNRLERLLAPRSIAFVGGRDAAEAVRVCRRFGYGGQIWPVSRSRAAMDGIPSVNDLDALPAPPDAAFIGVNREATPAVLARLAALGAGGAIVYASGFRESVGEIDGGADLEAELVAAAGAMPFLGPNCYGLINAASGASIWPSEHGVVRAEKGAAILSQSTNIVISMTMQRRGLPLALAGAVGNQAQTGLSALGRAALALETVTALGLYIEAIDDAAGFEALAAAARAAAKPIVVMKSGASVGARQAMLSHTASLAGSDRAADAFFDRLGIARVRSIPALLETLKLLHVHGPLPGGRLAAMCCSGGETAVISDAAEGRRAQFPALTPSHRAAVKATLPAMVSVSNPLDYHTFIWGDEARLTKTFTAMWRGEFDLGLLTLDWVRTDRDCSDKDWWPTLKAIEAAARDTGMRTGVMATMPENLPEPIAERLLAQGLAPLAGVDEALTAVDAAVRIGAAWARPVPPPLLRGPCAAHSAGGPRLLDEAAAKAALAAHGAPIPRHEVAPADDVEAAAERIGGATSRVAVKALGLAHKTEAGAVRLGLTPVEAAAAAAEMSERLGVTRFLVETMAETPVAELIVGVTRDPPYGLSLTIGAGGVFTELLRDTTTLLLPTSAEALREAILSLHLAPVLSGWRGAPGADIDAAIAAILAIARYAEAHATRLLELDVNPLMLHREGALAVDALIRLEEHAS